MEINLRSLLSGTLNDKNVIKEYPGYIYNVYWGIQRKVYTLKVEVRH